MNLHDSTLKSFSNAFDKPLFNLYDSLEVIDYEHDTIGGEKSEPISSFVSVHTKSTLNAIERPDTPEASQMETIIILISFGLVVGARQLFPRKFSQGLLSSTASSHLNQMLREWVPIKHFLGFVYFLLYILTFSLFLYHISHIVLSDGLGYGFVARTYWTICLIVATVLVSKTLLIILLAKLFRTKKQSVNYLGNQLSFFLVGGIYFLAISLVLVYGKGFIGLELGVTFVAIFMIYRLIRSFFSALPERPYGLLYLFLYLCALEIMPLLLLAKTIHNFGQGEL
jgi:hypothetical protein